MTADWRQRAACRNPAYNPDWWFPEPGDPGNHGARAKAICARCPVRAECLTDALETREIDGIRGGFGGKERRRFRQGRGRTGPKPTWFLSLANSEEVAARRAFDRACRMGVCELAGRLGIDEVTLYRAWRKYGLGRPSDSPVYQAAHFPAAKDRRPA